MKAFIVTKGVASRFKVLPVIERHGWDAVFCCDSNKQRNRLIRLGVDKSAIAVTNLPPIGIQGVSRARDYVCRHLMPKNKWSVWIDDNVSSVTGLPPSLSTDRVEFEGETDWRKAFEKTLTRKGLRSYFDETIAYADELGTIFCGMANENNYFFRKLKWQYFGYCRTQLALYKNDGSSWFPFKTMMLEDLAKSIDVVCRYGTVLINRHVKPVKNAFEKGGIGSFEKRLPWLQDNCKRLMKMYPGLLRYAKGTDYGSGATDFHLTFAKRSQKTINQWRKEHGYAS